MKGSMKKQFEVGQLVRYKSTHGPGGHGVGSIGRVVAVDRDYYGAKQAFKVYGAQRGQAIGPWSANGIGAYKGRYQRQSYGCVVYRAFGGRDHEAIRRQALGDIGGTK